MSDSLAFIFSITGILLMVVIRFTPRNQRWSTRDFLPLVFWILTGVVTGTVIDQLLERLFQLDTRGVHKLAGGVVAGCGVRWYRNRSTKK